MQEGDNDYVYEEEMNDSAMEVDKNILWFSVWVNCFCDYETHSVTIIYIKAIWVIDQVGLQVGLRALNDRGRMNFMWKSQLKP